MTLAETSRVEVGPRPFINDKGRDVSASAYALVKRAAAQVDGQVSLFHALNKYQGNRGALLDTHPALTRFIEGGLPINGTAQAISEVLGQIGTTAIKINHLPVNLDGQFAHLHLVTATGAEAIGENNMTGKMWTRDQAFVAMSRIRIGAMMRDYAIQKEGLQLLDSLLTCMGTPSQLKRFDRIIQEEGRVTAEEHPAIMMPIQKENNGIYTIDLEARWGHNQDAWQILAEQTLEAYEDGLIDYKGVLKHQAFFQRIPDFLHATDYISKESKGSWEEVNAKGRLSTLAWEWPLVFRSFRQKNLFDFDDATVPKMRSMIQEGAQAIIDRFPHESAYYHKPGDPAYREADAALLYVAMSGTPELLSQMQELGFEPVDFSSNPFIAKEMAQGLSPVDAMYKVIFDTVNTLKDPVTGGYARYEGDSYQASGFWLPASWDALTAKDGLWGHEEELYRDDQGVLHFKIREQLLDAINAKIHGKGYGDTIARWMHPNAQAASIAFRRANMTADPLMREWYIQRGTRDLIDSLRMITGGYEYTLKPNGKGMVIEKMPAGMAPECYVTNVLPDGKKVVHVGPWGPLFWSAAAMGEMLAYAHQVE